MSFLYQYILFQICVLVNIWKVLFLVLEYKSISCSFPIAVSALSPACLVWLWIQPHGWMWLPDPPQALAFDQPNPGLTQTHTQQNPLRKHLNHKGQGFLCSWSGSSDPSLCHIDNSFIKNKKCSQNSGRNRKDVWMWFSDEVFADCIFTT